MSVQLANAADALSRIVAADRAPFVSRGDDSGTHKAELAIWTLAGIDIATLGCGINLSERAWERH